MIPPQICAFWESDVFMEEASGSGIFLNCSRGIKEKKDDKFSFVLSVGRPWSYLFI